MEGPSLPGFVQRRSLSWYLKGPRKQRPPTEYLKTTPKRLCRLSLTRIKWKTAAVFDSDRSTPAQLITGQQASLLVQCDVRLNCKHLAWQFREDARTSKQERRLKRRCHSNHCTCSSTSRGQIRGRRKDISASPEKAIADALVWCRAAQSGALNR